MPTAPRIDVYIRKENGEARCGVGERKSGSILGDFEGWIWTVKHTCRVSFHILGILENTGGHGALCYFAHRIYN